MDPTPYTLAKWQVIPGKEADFIAAWRALAAVFARLPAPPVWGTLVQSEADPTLFYSFGPWRSAADVAAMRGDPTALTALQAARALCRESTPANYRRVAHVDVASGRDDAPRR